MGDKTRVPCGCAYLGKRLPGEFQWKEVDGERVLLYGGILYHRENLRSEVCDEGPGAWGYDICVKRGDFFRGDLGLYTEEDAWYVALEPVCMQFEFGGKSIEIIHKLDDGGIRWTREYIASA